jgi:hypothetical protein
MGGHQPTAKGKEAVEEEGTSVLMPDVDEESRGPHCWKPPPEGFVKLNTDARYRELNGQARTGVIIRDCRGNVLLSAWRLIRHAGGADEAEADACLKGIRLVLGWIKQPVCVEADCASLILAINQKEEDRSRWAGVIKEIKATASLLPGCSFNHIKREANSVT